MNDDAPPKATHEAASAGPYLISAADDAPPPRPFAELKSLADLALTTTPVSVMQKAKLPPSGDMHDWMNLADYSWPDPNAQGGLPYVTRDGEANPEADLYDRRRFNVLVVSVIRLGTAWQVTRESAYAEKAVALMHHWFIDPATAMNPRLDYAHHVPGDVPGRMDGLIVFCSALPSLLDIWLDLNAHGKVAPDAHAAMESWADAFLAWLLENPISLEHAEAENNHGSYHDFLVAYLALFLGKRQDAAQTLAREIPRRLADQVAPTGEQPMETGRTLSAQYSMYNLKALMGLARLADAMGLDGWERTSPDPGILLATKFLYDHAVGDRAWPFPQIEPANWWFLAPLCAAANNAYGHTFDASRIDTAALGADVPVEPAVFMPGCELLFAPSHRQHLPLATA